MTACGGGRSIPISIELAEPVSESACGSQSPTRPSGVGCVTIEVWALRGGLRERVLLVLPDQPHTTGAGVDQLRLPGPTIRFDAMLDPEIDHELDIRVYDDGAGAASSRAFVRNVRFDGRPINVRLHPYRQWACPGPRSGGGLPLPRALHGAVRVDNDDVVLFGGVTARPTGSGAIEASGDLGPLIQPAIEVFDASESRFYVVQGAQLPRVLFAARYLGREGALHRIRVVGGYEVTDPSAAAVTLEATLRFPGWGAPLYPSPSTQVADTVDLLYDPQAHSVQVVPAMTTPRGGLNVLATNDAGESLVVLGYQNWTSPATMGMRPDLSGQFHYLGMDGVAVDPGTLLRPRLGAAVAYLGPPGNEFVVWGGNVTAAGIDELRAGAGEILSRGRPAALVSTGLGLADDLPDPVAFATATRFGDSVKAVLIAGGLRIDPATQRIAPSPETDPPPLPDPLFVLEPDPTMPGRYRRVGGDASLYQPTTFHAVVPVEEDALRESPITPEVWLVGGAVWSYAGADRSTLVETTQVGRVRYLGTSFSYEQMPSLTVGRWGHSATLLSDGRLLVVGGFRRPSANPVAEMELVPVAEVMDTEPAPVTTVPPSQCVSTGVDAGMDAGPPDAGPPPVDAGPPDAGADGGM